MAVVFFVYSHRDEELRDQLEKHLVTLKRQNIVETWHDRRIAAGDEFADKISSELERADVILLLVSADFLASEYCFNVEMRRALERHERKEARVIPIILRPCDWSNTPLKSLLVAPTDGKPVMKWPDRDEAFVDVVKKIRDALEPVTRTDNETSSVKAEDIKPSTAQPRSSNLRVRKRFTDAEKDRFTEEAFSFMSRYFEMSLRGLVKRNPQLETGFKQIATNRFRVKIYDGGNLVSQCQIIHNGGPLGKGITYSKDASNYDSFNEQMLVESDDQSLYLKALGMGQWGMQQKNVHFTHEGAAEYYWSMLMRPIQPQ